MGLDGSMGRTLRKKTAVFAAARIGLVEAAKRWIMPGWALRQLFMAPVPRREQPVVSPRLDTYGPRVEHPQGRLAAPQSELSMRAGCGKRDQSRRPRTRCVANPGAAESCQKGDEQIAALVREALGAEAYAEAVAAGRALSLDQAVDVAIAIADDVAPAHPS